MKVLAAGADVCLACAGDEYVCCEYVCASFVCRGGAMYVSYVSAEEACTRCRDVAWVGWPGP